MIQVPIANTTFFGYYCAGAILGTNIWCDTPMNITGKSFDYGNQFLCLCKCTLTLLFWPNIEQRLKVLKSIAYLLNIFNPRSKSASAFRSLFLETAAFANVKLIIFIKEKISSWFSILFEPLFQIKFCENYQCLLKFTLNLIHGCFI